MNATKVTFSLQITHVDYGCHLKSLRGSVFDLRVVGSPPLVFGIHKNYESTSKSEQYEQYFFRLQ